MCSLGHHDGPDRVARRHLDKSATNAVAQTPRTEMQKRRAAVIASLRASKETGEADDLADQHSAHQLELVPRDMAQLPAHSFKTRALPEPSSLYYSAARER